MKRTSLIPAFAAVLCTVISVSSCNQNGTNGVKANAEGADSTAIGGIVYVDLDRISKEYDMAIDLTAVVNTKGEALEKEISRRGSKIQRDASAFQEKVNKGLLTQSVAEVQYRKIQEDQANFQEYASKREREISQEMMKVQGQIENAVNEYIKRYNESKGYAMILATQGANLSVPVITAAEGLDITDEILEGLNKEYTEQKDNPSKNAEADSTKTK